MYCRARHDIIERPINHEADTRFTRLVKLCSFGATLQPVGARTFDHDIDAVGVMLSTVWMVCSHQCDNLVADNIRARLDTIRNFECVFIAIFSEGVSSPFACIAISFASHNLTNGVNFVKLQIGFVDSETVTVAAWGHIGDNWAVMAFWPRGPLNCQYLSGRNVNILRGVGRADVANDIFIGVLVRINESRINDFMISPAAGWVGSLRIGIRVVSRIPVVCEPRCKPG